MYNLLLFSYHMEFVMLGFFSSTSSVINTVQIKAASLLVGHLTLFMGLFSKAAEATKYSDLCVASCASGGAATCSVSWSCNAPELCEGINNIQGSINNIAIEKLKYNINASDFMGNYSLAVQNFGQEFASEISELFFKNFDEYCPGSSDISSANVSTLPSVALIGLISLLLLTRMIVNTNTPTISEDDLPSNRN